jgi:hypothetical protein
MVAIEDRRLDRMQGARASDGQEAYERDIRCNEQADEKPARRTSGATQPNVPAMNVPATSPITRNSTIAAMITTPV